MTVLQNHIALFDTEKRHANLMPLSATRPVAAFRLGITTIKEKWESCTSDTVSYYSVEYLREAFPLPDFCASYLFVAGNVIPNEMLVERLSALQPGEGLQCDGEPLAFIGTPEEVEKFDFSSAPDFRDVKMIRFVFDLFLMNGEMIERDFREITSGRKSQPLSLSNKVIGKYEDEDGKPRIFIEEGASVEGAIINLDNGPVYIGKDAQVMEGVLMRGPIAFCDNAKARMGAKIYGGTTFGPYCKVGGEIDNVIFFGYSNKAHDGYLGNAVIGEWCNIGAGVNASNLKNDYAKIRIWNYYTQSFMRTDLQFCGLIMGDHSKVGINCMFNTATVVGVGVNVHGSGFPRVFLQSFVEGSPAGGFSAVPRKKFFDIAERAMARRGLLLEGAYRGVFEKLYADLHAE